MAIPRAFQFLRRSSLREPASWEAGINRLLSHSPHPYQSEKRQRRAIKRPILHCPRKHMSACCISSLSTESWASTRLNRQLGVYLGLFQHVPIQRANDTHLRPPLPPLHASLAERGMYIFVESGDSGTVPGSQHSLVENSQDRRPICMGRSLHTVLAFFFSDEHTKNHGNGNTIWTQSKHICIAGASQTIECNDTHSSSSFELLRNCMGTPTHIQMLDA